MTNDDISPEGTPSSSEPQGEAPAEPTIADVLAELKSTRERYDAKTADLAKQIGKLKERSRTQADGAQGNGESPSGVTREELKASRELGTVLASLPESLQEQVSEIESSQGIIPALSWAHAAQAGMKADQKSRGTAKPTRASSAPDPSPVAAPSSKSELLALARSNPAEYRKVMDLARSGAIKLPS